MKNKVLFLFMSFILLSTTCIEDECEGYYGKFVDTKLSGDITIFIGKIEDKRFVNNFDDKFIVSKTGIQIKLGYAESNTEKFHCFNKRLLDTLIDIYIVDENAFNNSIPANEDIKAYFEVIDANYNLRYSVLDYLDKYQFLTAPSFSKNITLVLIDTPFLNVPHRFKFRIKYASQVIESTSKELIFVE